MTFVNDKIVILLKHVVVDFVCKNEPESWYFMTRIQDDDNEWVLNAL